MKRFGLFLVASLLLFSVVKPAVGLAAINKDDMDKFYQAEGIDQETLGELLLTYFGEELADFNSVDELRSLLGERITEDNLNQIIQDLGFNDLEELTDQLVDEGSFDESKSIQDTFYFRNALENALGQAPQITDANLKELLSEYEMTLDELNQLLAAHGDKLSNYEYLDELDAAISEYIMKDFLVEVLKEFGLDGEEINNLREHLATIDFEDPALEERMDKLSERADNLPDFESASELTPAQMEEIVYLFNEVLDIFQMDAKFYLTKDGVKKPISIEELMVLETTNGADLLIELYNKQGKFLADFIITNEMFGSDLINGEIGKVTKSVKAAPKVEHKAGKTIKGGKLPNTAGNYAEGVLMGTGILFAGAGLLLFRRKNKDIA